MTPPIIVRPGPPEYTYAGNVVRVMDGKMILADICLGLVAQGIAVTQDRDFGFHIRRSDGWLIWRWPIHLAGIKVQPTGRAADHLAAMFDTRGRFTMQTTLVDTDPVGVIHAVIWPLHAVESVNDRMVADGYARKVA